MQTKTWQRAAFAVALSITGATCAAFEPMYTRTNPSDRVASPGDNARPGETFFAKGVTAVKMDDYKHAIEMYKVSASWAYKPAQYNLGVIYSTGDGGVEVDKPLGLAWLALAAERDDADYVAARDLAYSKMTDEEYAKANDVWRELRKKYGDEVALKRAKSRWRQVRSEATGSHVGGATGPMKVGGRDTSGSNVVSNPNSPHDAKANSSTHTSFGITGAGAVDGSIAYRDLRATDNPYDPKLRQPEGVVSVGDVIPISEKVRRTQPETTHE
jgi:hypothetical protein